ncbi:Thioredoxin family protein [Histomonas meleagridis]|uniref:Thioredoxin family protein n=1 Tax=Histomonas meleagridis TaxID=135588 RepID=UPI00355958DF|nr:Thioredoxin family protein [Histomonas meleagridis]KAH0806671.1 Thioredoxin family protein [Histomonas meleagridis]
MVETPSNLIIFSGKLEDLNRQIAEANCLVVVDFFATWCPPCNRLGDHLPALAAENPKTLFVKINVDEHRDLTTHFGINSIPHVKFFKADQGSQIQELASITGVDIQQMKSKLQQFG